MTIDDEVLYKKYNLDIEFYRGVAIDFDALRIRTGNCLRAVGIYEMDQLLSSTYDKLSKIRNLGMLSLNDIEGYIKMLDAKDIERKDVSDNYISSTIERWRDHIFNGEFCEEMYDGLNEQELEVIGRLREGSGLIDHNLIKLCREKPEAAYTISEMLNVFVRQTEKYTEFDKLYDLVKEKAGNRIKPYYEVYPLRDELSAEFREYCENGDVTLSTLFDKTLTGKLPVEEKNKFVRWASYDLKKELRIFLDGYYARSVNTEKILKLRARKCTLQVIGDELGITRERVRQIEKKVVQPFCHWQRVKKFLPRLSADFNGETILEATELQEYFGDVTEVLLYLLQCADDEFFSYDRETDTVIIVDDDITDFARDFVEKMPDEFDTTRVDEYRQKALDEHEIPVDIFDREIAGQYNLSGAHYHRNKLSLEKMYQIVLKRYYPDGMNVYDEDELDKFRRLLVNEFGNVSLPKKNRAISAAIGRSCILCGRGRYRVKENEKIPHELIKKIHRYIMDSDRSLFFMNEIYLEFENELCDAGIDNRFFLQGVLREEYENELFFKRDYVSKDSENLSMYRELQLFVKKSEYPVTKDQIREVYPGITEIMISISLADDEIINYRGSYIHSSNLNLFDDDKKYINRVVNEILSDTMPHHCDEIFLAMQGDNPDMLNRLGIYYQYSLFSLLQYLYSDNYEFARPYIACKGVVINRPIELLQEYVSANEVFEITEFIGLAREYHYTIYDILKFLNSWNDSHLLINKREMASIEHIGITEEIANEVEKIISDKLEKSSLIANLECIYKLPELNVPWTEWLVYSIIKRWGSVLETDTTSSQFRLSDPVVSRRGMFERNNYENSESVEMAKTIDLNDIDAVEDYIMEDFEVEW